MKFELLREKEKNSKFLKNLQIDNWNYEETLEIEKGMENETCLICYGEETEYIKNRCGCRLCLGCWK